MPAMGANLWLALGTAAVYAGLSSLALVLPGRAAGRKGWRWVVPGSLLAGAGSFVLYLPTLSALRFDDWNWQGKFLQLLVAMSAIPLIGLRGVMGPGRVASWFSRPSLRLAVAIVALGCLSSYFFSGGAPEKHRLLFQLSMPGIAEEAFFRGSLLAITCRAWGSTDYRGRDALVPCLIVTAMFCFAHGFYPVDGRIAVDLPAMLSPLVIGTLLAALRHTSGSIVPCVVAHNVFNAV